MKKLCVLLAVALVLSLATPAFAFVDVPEGHWAEDYLEKIADVGIVIGFPDGTFRGAENLTRYQAATMTARMMDWVNETVEAALADVDFDDEELKLDIRNLRSDLMVLMGEHFDLEFMVLQMQDDMEALDAKIAEVAGQMDATEDELKAYVDQTTRALRAELQRQGLTDQQAEDVMIMIRALTREFRDEIDEIWAELDKDPALSFSIEPSFTYTYRVIDGTFFNDPFNYYTPTKTAIDCEKDEMAEADTFTASVPLTLHGRSDVFNLDLEFALSKEGKEPAVSWDSLEAKAWTDNLTIEIRDKLAAGYGYVDLEDRGVTATHDKGQLAFLMEPVTTTDDLYYDSGRPKYVILEDDEDEEFHLVGLTAADVADRVEGWFVGDDPEIVGNLPAGAPYNGDDVIQVEMEDGEPALDDDEVIIEAFITSQAIISQLEGLWDDGLLELPYLVKVDVEDDNDFEVPVEDNGDFVFVFEQSDAYPDYYNHYLFGKYDFDLGISENVAYFGTKNFTDANVFGLHNQLNLGILTLSLDSALSHLFIDELDELGYVVEAGAEVDVNPFTLSGFYRHVSEEGTDFTFDPTPLGGSVPSKGYGATLEGTIAMLRLKADYVDTYAWDDGDQVVTNRVTGEVGLEPALTFGPMELSADYMYQYDLVEAARRHETRDVELAGDFGIFGLTLGYAYEDGVDAALPKFTEWWDKEDGRKDVPYSTHEVYGGLTLTPMERLSLGADASYNLLSAADMPVFTSGFAKLTLIEGLTLGTDVEYNLAADENPLFGNVYAALDRDLGEFFGFGVGVNAGAAYYFGHVDTEAAPLTTEAGLTLGKEVWEGLTWNSFASVDYRLFNPDRRVAGDYWDIGYEDGMLIKLGTGFDYKGVANVDFEHGRFNQLGEDVEGVYNQIEAGLNLSF